MYHQKTFKMIFQEPNVTSSDVLFCPTTGPKHKNIKFTDIKQRYLQKLKQRNIFLLKNVLSDESIINIV